MENSSSGTIQLCQSVNIFKNAYLDKKKKKKPFPLSKIPASITPTFSVNTFETKKSEGKMFTNDFPYLLHRTA